MFFQFLAIAALLLVVVCVSAVVWEFLNGDDGDDGDDWPQGGVVA